MAGNRAAKSRLLRLAAIGIALLWGAMVTFKAYWRRTHPRPTWIASPLPSPNYDSRPWWSSVDAIVLHATAGTSMTSAEERFLTPSSRVSAHFVVGKDGAVVQMVPLEYKAWHAGQSELDGHCCLNDDSIGIEMVNRNDGIEPYPAKQYRAVASLVRKLQVRFDIADDHVVSHASVATPRGRKTDPAGFDFARLMRIVHRGRKVGNP